MFKDISFFYISSLVNAFSLFVLPSLRFSTRSNSLLDGSFSMRPVLSLNKTLVQGRALLKCSRSHISAKLISSSSKRQKFKLVCPIPEDKYSEVISHLRANFFNDEPLNKFIGIRVAPGESHAELEADALATLQEGLSIMALSEKGELAGVSLNTVCRPGDIEAAVEKLSCLQDEKLKIMFSHLYRINLELDLFNRFSVDEIFEARILSVDKAYRGQGLAKLLMAKCDEVAESSGFKLIKVDATSLFTQKTLTKLGYETILEGKYEDIKDENGEVTFKSSEPHLSLKIMIKRVGE